MRVGTSELRILKNDANDSTQKMNGGELLQNPNIFLEQYFFLKITLVFGIATNLETPNSFEYL